MTRDDRGRPHDDDGGTPGGGADAARPPDDGPIDLSALRTSAGRRAGPAHWEALARRIGDAAAAELARRAASAKGGAHGGVAAGGAAPGVLVAIARAARPALLAVAASVVFALAVERTVRTAETTTAVAGMEPSLGTTAEAGADELSVARALSVDEPAASWLTQQRAPNASDLARIIDPEVAQ